MAAVLREHKAFPVGEESRPSVRRIQVPSVRDALIELGIPGPDDHVVAQRGSAWTLFLEGLSEDSLFIVDDPTPEAFCARGGAEEPAATAGRTWWLVSVPAGATLRVPDVRALAQSAHARGAVLVVDATATGAFGCDALGLGADIAVEPVPSPLTADGSLQRRFDAARAIAEYLRCHPAIPRTWYPGLKAHPDHAVAARTMRHGFGARVTFELPQHVPAGAFVERFEAYLAEAPEPSPYPTRLEAEDGLDGHLVCLIAGLDDPIDIADDLDQALRWFCNPPEP